MNQDELEDGRVGEKDKKGWYIGISLKRTLRERWKQTYTTEIGLLDRHKIKHIVHIINNDSDLSDAKVTELGSYRHLFFLHDMHPCLPGLPDKPENFVRNLF